MIIACITFYKSTTQIPCSFWKTPGGQQGGVRVSDYPPWKVSAGGLQSSMWNCQLHALKATNMPIRPMYGTSGRGEKPKVRRAIAPRGSLVCVAQHWVQHLNNIPVLYMLSGSLLTRLKKRRWNHAHISKIQLIQIYSMTMASVSHSNESCQIILGEFMERLGKVTTSSLFNLVPMWVLSKCESIFIHYI